MSQSSRLRFGSLPPPYGAITPNHTGGLSQRRTPTVARYWLTICLAIILFQTVLTICRSDALAMLIDLESAAHRASKERLALMVERGKSEQEREKMKHDRELWEKAREDRVPHNAFWDAISPAPACSAYGKREYSSTLQNIPEGWTAIDACINMPIEIKGVTVRRPNRCAFVKGSPHVHGYWMVDWDEPSCKPRWYNYQDVGCTSYKSGVRRIEGELIGLIDKKDQDLGLMCASTPLIWNYITYTSPTHCEERYTNRMFGMWDVPDNSCL